MDMDIFSPLLDCQQECFYMLKLIKEDVTQFKKTGKFLLFDENGKTEEFIKREEAYLKKQQLPLLEVSQNSQPKEKSIDKESLEIQTTVSIKQEKLDDIIENKENNEVGCMGPPAAKPRGRKPKIKTEPVKSTRSTRSKKITETDSQSSDLILAESIRSTRSTRTKKVIEQDLPKSSIDSRSSDVILQKEDIPVVDLNSPAKSEEIPAPKIKKPARKLYKNSEEKKRNLSISSDDHEGLASVKLPPPKKIRQKKVKKEVQSKEKEEESVYEDARSSVESHRNAEQANNLQMETTYACSKSANDNIMDKTVVISKEINLANETVLIEKPTVLKLNETVVLSKKDDALKMDDLMTDDESFSPTKFEEVVQPEKLKKNAKVTSKPIFSPYENSPVKKRVEAFERIANEQATEVRMTRSKKKPQPSQDKSVSQKMTPLKTSRLPTLGSTSKLFSKATTPLSERSASAMKASQQEYREREMRRLEKEKELLKIKQQQAEENKRKREEKHIKAQKKREEEENKRKKLLEEHLQKEQEKREQLLAEREEKLRQKAESEKKRLLAAKEKKLEEDRKKQEEEEKIKQEQRIAEHKVEQIKVQKPAKNYPIYMTQAMPLLPTDDCYDSDDPEAQYAKPDIPSWARKSQVYKMLKLADNASHKLKNTFFCTKPTTLNLGDIFQNIDPRKLKRTSSAVWRQAPRFTLLPRTEESFIEHN